MLYFFSWVVQKAQGHLKYAHFPACKSHRHAYSPVGGQIQSLSCRWGVRTLVKSHSPLSSRLLPLTPHLQACLCIWKLGRTARGEGLLKVFRGASPRPRGQKASRPFTLQGIPWLPVDLQVGQVDLCKEKAHFLPIPLPLGNLPHRVCRLSWQKLLHSPSLPPLSLFCCEGFTITAL